MRTVQFEGTLTPGDQITLPPEIDSNLDDGDDTWRKIGQQSFRAAYAPEDAIFEQLIDDFPIRGYGPNPHRFPWRLTMARRALTQDF